MLKEKIAAIRQWSIFNGLGELRIFLWLIIIGLIICDTIERNIAIHFHSVSLSISFFHIKILIFHQPD